MQEQVRKAEHLPRFGLTAKSEETHAPVDSELVRSAANLSFGFAGPNENQIDFTRSSEGLDQVKLALSG
jgi:hypothetical protein